MSLIQVKNLSFTYEDCFDPVFENVSFQIDTDWKLGFIGRNGKGKTTFLKLLTGEYEYSGTILSSVDFEYFPYQVENKAQLTYEIAESVNPRHGTVGASTRTESPRRGCRDPVPSVLYTQLRGTVKSIAGVSFS